MVQAYIFLLPTSIEASSSSFTKGNLFVSPKICRQQQWNHRTKHHLSPVASSAANQNHYHVLGIPSTASYADVKRAYRLLARKYHPDVNKEAKAGETFKSIRHAYDVLSNGVTRAQYDHALNLHDNSSNTWRQNWVYDSEFEEVAQVYRWAEVRRQMRRESYWKRYKSTENDPSSFGGTKEAYKEESPDYERGSFLEVLKSTFLVVFFGEIFGSQVALMLCSLTAMLDKKLDGGYKMGYLLAWILGGRGGVMLTLCLSFASWVCGKTSSSTVALVVVAMWVGTNLARYAPFPHGALIALLYMSAKLQVEIS